MPFEYIDDKRQATQSPAILALPAAYTSGGATVTVTATAPGSASGTSKATSAPPSDSTTVGLGAGLGVGLPLLIALLTVLFFLYRARRKIQHLERQGGSPVYPDGGQSMSIHAPREIKEPGEAGSNHLYEAPDNSR